MKKVIIIVCAVLGGLIAIGVISSLFESDEQKERRTITAFNDTDKKLIVGVEYEDFYSTETVEPHNYREFTVPPGKGHAIVLNEDSSVFRKGTKWMTIKPASAAPEGEELYLDASGEGMYAVVDINFLYSAKFKAIESFRDSIYKQRKYIQGLMSASDIMVLRQPFSGSARVYPFDAIPSKIKWGERVFAYRKVSKELNSISAVLEEVSRQIVEEENK